MTAGEWADRYRAASFNPLPSKDCGGRLHPPFRYGHARDNGLSPASFARLADRLDCRAVQVPTGSKWGLLVIDLDGPMAVDVWRAWSLHRDNPPTWAVQHDPAGGMHLWYSVARDAALPFKTPLWWLGETAETSGHNCIEALGDGNLIVAPPSVSPKSGLPYRFLPGRGPDDIAAPAPLPGWVAAAIAKHASAPAPVEAPGRMPVVASGSGAPVPRLHLDWSEVRDHIPDKVGLLRSWGVRVVATKPGGKGWYAARSIFREDRRPSAAVNELGDYWEPQYGSRCLSIFQVAVAIGLYRDFAEAVDGLGIQHGVRTSTWRPRQRTA
jgi:hypothetical protein